MRLGRITAWQLIGFGGVSLVGSLLHFLYALTGSRFTALFSAVNESTFEHMKILFFPMLLFTLIEYFAFGRDTPGFWCVALRGIICGVGLIPMLFYTLNGIFGKTPDLVNIMIFFVSAACAFLQMGKELSKEKTSCKCEALALPCLLLLTLAFSLFTFYPPHIPLFEDPLGAGYGIAS